MTRHLLYKFFDRGIDWLFRPRTLAVALLKYGVLLAGAALGVDILAQLDFSSQSSSWSFRLATGEGLPKWASLSAYVVGGILILLGMIVAGLRAWADVKRERRQKLIVVELRGLHTSPDTPAKDANLGDFLGERHWVQVDFRPQKAGELVDPDRLLERVRSIKPTVESLAAGRDNSDVFLAVGGLAAVPALFLTGMLIDDESNTIIYDWDRNVKAWRLIDGPDDGKRFLPFDKTAAGIVSSEAILTVAVSYSIDLAAIEQTFSQNLPLFSLTAEKVVADRCWSIEKQQALVAAFRDAVQNLMAHGIQKIHLVLACPASLAIRMGMAYDFRLMPDIVVYQYEKSATPPYPWGINMPMHGRIDPVVIPTASVASFTA